MPHLGLVYSDADTQRDSTLRYIYLHDEYKDDVTDAASTIPKQKCLEF